MAVTCIKTCKCGCGQEMEAFDMKGRERFYIKGHNNRGRKLSKEHKKKLSKAKIGNTNGFKKGNKLWNNPGAKRNWFKKGEGMREENRNWNGGSSFEPYTTDWTQDLKRAIRKRDRYTCQLCGLEPATFVHHINYDKKNCDPKNLITLCNSCHSKTNHNRKKWMKMFQKLE